MLSQYCRSTVSVLSGYGLNTVMDLSRYCLLESTWVYLGLLVVYLGLLGSNRVYMGLHGVYLGLHGSTWVYLGLLGSAWDLLGFQLVLLGSS